MHVFYTPDLGDNEFYSLNEEESKHCAKVLRLSIGDKIQLIDGRGGFFEAEIISAGKRRVDLKILSRQLAYKKQYHFIHIGIAPTKNIDRLSWFLEKCTEIGIDEISTFICDRSERKILKEERLDKIITAAVKQSLKAYHPQLNNAVRYKDFIQQDFTKYNGNLFIAHCEQDSQKLFLGDLAQPNQSYLVLIGPEGDFSSEEITLAKSYGFKPITLGESRLRTETAGVAACFELNYINR
ncbi:MAG: 16S rRNA (uracil(1498)-N(3))-methyltransferase [Pedobacter sp.]|nr:MAG: 16S rRNA (uracil(1498)-N(3))-methyltransferase [Pedobacter sp.]